MQRKNTMSIRSITVLLLLGLLFPSSFCLLAQTDSCTITWDNIIQISHDTIYSYVPQVVAVGDTVHLLWWGGPSFGGGGSALGIQYSRSVDGGQTFSPQQQLVTWDSARGNAGYLVASGRYLYIMYIARVDSPVYSNLGLLRSTDAGLTWEPRRVLGDVSGRAITARDSNVYIYFTYVENNFGRSGFFISHDYGVTWDSIHVPTLRATSFARLVATSAALHLTRAIGVSGSNEVLYNRSLDFGYTWTSAETLSTADGIISDEANMVSDASGNIYVLWRDGKYGTIDGFHASAILRRSSDHGLTWGEEQLLTYTPTALFPKIAQYGSNIVVAWNEYIDYYHDRSIIRVSTNGGDTWCDTVQVDTSGGNVDVAVCKGHLHVTWLRSIPTNIPAVYTGEIFYRRGNLTLTEVTEEKEVPLEFSLYQNYPNPFNGSTIIRFTLPHDTFVTLKIFNLLGQEITTLLSEITKAGEHSVQWNPTTYLPSGVYFYQLQTKRFLDVKKLILLK